jgi:hypothetical protein
MIDIVPNPTHFGYETNKTLYDSFNFTNTYLITTQNGIDAQYAFPNKIRILVRQWNQSDFIKLRNDSTANKIYNNPEFKSYLIKT